MPKSGQVNIYQGGAAPGGFIDYGGLTNYLNSAIDPSTFAGFNSNQDKLGYLNTLLAKPGVAYNRDNQNINLQDSNVQQALQGYLTNNTYTQNAPSQLAANQAQTAQQFRSQMPAMQNKIASSLAQSSSMTNNQQNRQINRFNAGRGLGYGGLNQGMQAANTAQNQGLLAQNITNANASLSNTANSLEGNALSTGAAVQGLNQQVQNDLYSQALAQQQANQSTFGGLLQTGATVGLIAALA